MKELIIKKGDKQITVADKEDVTSALNNKSKSTHGHGNLQNDGRVGTSNNASKNVVTDGSGKITTEAKPTIPTKVSQLTNDSNYTTAIGHNHDGVYLKSYTPPTASTSQAGIVQLSTSTSGTSTSKAATESAVKAAYDLANGKITNGTGTVTSTNIANKTIVNEDIADNAAIAYSKLSGVVSSTDPRLTDNRKPINNSITANSDLNNFKTAGFYYCQGDVEVAPTVTNQPLTTNQKSFVMLVEQMSSTRTVQILTYYYTKDTYTRTNINGDWSTWNRVIHTGNFSEYVDTALSTTSTNPLTNARITTALGDKLNLTGGTMTGNIKMPSEYQGTNGATGNIPFAGHLDKTSQSITDALPTLKSVVATIKTNDNKWWNILSIRHRNGSGDGNLLGLYLKSLLTGNGDLIWNKQYSNSGVSTWVGERTILDSSNYSNYANKTTVDSALSSTSTNPVQNKVINTALDTKQNKVETQAKVAQFMNKDRITLERTIERMNNPDSKALFLRPTDSSLPDYTFCENIKVATTYNRGVSLYLDGAAIGTSASSVVLKKIDGTEIWDFNKRGTDPAGWGCSFAGANLGVGIHYLYAEATFPDGSVRKSNILSVFVKDTNNILPHELWTPEYLDKVPRGTYGDFRLNTTTNDGYTYSNNYSSIGEYSIMQKVDNPQYLALMDNNPNINKNYTMQADIYTTVDVILYFVARKSSTNTVVKTLTIPAGSNTSPSMTINSNEFVGGETQLQFRIVPSVSNGTIYSTNFRLYQQ